MDSGGSFLASRRAPTGDVPPEVGPEDIDSPHADRHDLVHGPSRGKTLSRFRALPDLRFREHSRRTAGERRRIAAVLVLLAALPIRRVPPDRVVAEHDAIDKGRVRYLGVAQC